MLDTCLTLLREGVAVDEDVIDAAMICGSEFALFRGGLLHSDRARGPADIRARLSQLPEIHGDRFAPDPGWERLEAKGG